MLLGGDGIICQIDEIPLRNNQNTIGGWQRKRIDTFPIAEHSFNSTNVYMQTVQDRTESSLLPKIIKCAEM